MAKIFKNEKKWIEKSKSEKSEKIAKIHVFFCKKILREIHFLQKLKKSLFQLFPKMSKMNFFVRFQPGFSKMALFWKNWKNRVSRCVNSRFCTCELHKKSRFYSSSLNPDFTRFSPFFQFLPKRASSEFISLMVRLKFTFKNWIFWKFFSVFLVLKKWIFRCFWKVPNFANVQKHQKSRFLVFLKNEK